MAQGSWPKGFVEDRYDFFFDGFDSTISMIDTLYEIKMVTEGAYDARTSAIGPGVLAQRTSENATVTYRRPSEGFTAYCAYRDFDDGLELTRNEVEYFPSSKVRDMVQTHITGWGRALRLTEDRFGASLFKNGGKTAGHDDFKNVVPGLLSQNTDGLAYDATEFFNRSTNTRASKGGKTYHNALALNLNNANFGTLHDRIFVSNAFDERDEEVELKSMGKPVIVYPPQLRDSAIQALKSEYLPGAGAANDRNPWFNAVELVEWSLLRANSTAWYLGIAKMGIRFYRRGKPEIRMFRDESSGSYRATIRASYGWMAWNWRFWSGSNVPTS